MFKELVSYYLKYQKHNCFLSAQMFETIRNNIENDLIESYELSSHLVQDHATLFHSSQSYFDFLLKLFNIKNFDPLKNMTDYDMKHKYSTEQGLNFDAEMENLKQDLKQCRDNLKQCQDDLKQCRDNKNAISDQLTRDLKQLTLELENCKKALKTCKDYKEKYEAYDKNKNEKHTEELSQLQQQNIKLKVDCENLKETNQNFITKIGELEQYIEGLRGQLEVYNDWRKELKNEPEPAMEYTTPKEEELESYDLKAQWIETEQKLQDATVLLNNLNEQNLKFQREIELKNEQMNDLRKNHQMEMDELTKTFQKDQKYLIQQTMQQTEEWKSKEEHFKMLYSQCEIQDRNLNLQRMENVNRNKDLQSKLNQCEDMNEELNSHLTDCQQKNKQLITHFEEIYEQWKLQFLKLKEHIFYLDKQLTARNDDYKMLQERYDKDTQYLNDMYKQVIAADQKVVEDSWKTEWDPPRTNNYRERFVHAESKYKVYKRKTTKLLNQYKYLLRQKQIELDFCVENYKNKKSQEEMELVEQNIALQNKIYFLTHSSKNVDDEYEQYKMNQKNHLAQLREKLTEKDATILKLHQKLNKYRDEHKSNLDDIKSKLLRKNIEAANITKELNEQRKILEQKTAVRTKDLKNNLATKITRKYLRQSRAKIRQKDRQKAHGVQRDYDSEQPSDSESSDSDSTQTLEKTGQDILNDAPYIEGQDNLNDTPYINTKFISNNYEHEQLIKLCKCIYLKYFDLYYTCVKKSERINPSIEELDELLKQLQDKPEHGGNFIQILFDYVIREVEIIKGKYKNHMNHADEMMKCVLNCINETNKYINDIQKKS